VVRQLRPPLAGKSGKAQNIFYPAAPPGFISAPTRVFPPMQIHKENRIF